MTDNYIIYAIGEAPSLIVAGATNSVVVAGVNNRVISATPGVGKDNIVVMGIQGPAGSTGAVGPRGAATLAIAAALNRIQIPMTLGVINYTLPDLPGGSVLAFMNGIELGIVVDGVNISLVDITPGEVDNSDVLTMYY